MRPDPNHGLPDTDTGRIISLGEVRRRKSRHRSTDDRSYLAVLVFVGAMGWALWSAVLLSLRPARLLTYLAFFVPLSAALAATLALGLYWLEYRRHGFPLVTRAVRRGTLVSTVACANLAMQAAHRWNPVVLVVAVGAGFLVDAVAGRRGGEG